MLWSTVWPISKRQSEKKPVSERKKHLRIRRWKTVYKCSHSSLKCPVAALGAVPGMKRMNRNTFFYLSFKTGVA